jgi:sialic acid synthase SpsE
MEMKIRNRSIGEAHPTYFVADIAANHCGDLELAKELICTSARAGADAVKFQNFTAESLVSDFGFKNLKDQATHQSKWKTSVFDSYVSASIPLEWTPILQETAHSAGVDYFTSPYSVALLEGVISNIDAIKIGSGDITHIDLVEVAAKSSLPILIATGASTMEDVVFIMNIASKYTREICLMQCTTDYTASLSDNNDEVLDRYCNINLKVLETFQNKFPDVVLGLSDHTHGCLTVLGAVGLYGCSLVEKHFTLDNTKIGQDHSFSMTPVAWEEMVSKVRMLESRLTAESSFDTRMKHTVEVSGDHEAIEACLGDGVKRVMENETKTIIVQRRSICASGRLTKGRILERSDLVSLRPAPDGALAPRDVSKLIGKSLTRTIEKGENITVMDVKNVL